MKYFIITVDTEGDNLWNYKKNQLIKTENSLYLPRFQELCEKYAYKPVWLTNYEMVCDQRYVDFIKPKMEQGLCEVGIHVHAWNNPPMHQLEAKYSGNPYLIEYPDDIMRQKFSVTYNLIEEKFGIKVKSHRAGRWAMDNRYFSLLNEYNVAVDCSHTPGVSWTKTCGETIYGPDYSKVPLAPSRINGILEVPMTIKQTHISQRGSIKHKIKVLIFGEQIWLRPASSTADEMKALIRKICMDKKIDYLEFMIHSSELMPGGSPYFPDTDSVERLYSTMEIVFDYVKQLGYLGVTLFEYNNIHSNK